MISTKTTLRSRFPKFVLISLCALSAFLSFLDRRDIVTSHEARVVQTAREMAASGWPWNAKAIEVPVVGLHDENGDKRLGPIPGAGTTRVNPWLVPVINGNIRLQKPPVPYWCTSIAYRIFGFNGQAARWWTAALGAVATLILWDVARMTIGRRSATLAAMVWVSTQFIVDEFRKSLADPYLAFATLLAVWLWLRASRSRRSVWIVLFYIALALGALAKGPPLLLCLLPALFTQKLLNRSRRRAPFLPHIFGLAIFVALFSPWVIYVFLHVPHALEIWRYESIGEFADNAEKARPWWLYLLASFQLPLPWTPMWIAGLALFGMNVKRRGGWRSPRVRRRLFAIGWFAIVLVGFSFAHVKKNAYLLPVMATQTLIVADALRVTLRFAQRSKLRGLPAVLILMQCVIGIGYAIGLLVASTRLPADRAATEIVCSAALLLALTAMIPIFRKLPDAWMSLQTIAYVGLLIATIGFYLAAKDNFRSPREFARQAIAYSDAHRLPIATTLLPEEASVYMPLNYLHDDASSSNIASSSVLVMVDDSHFAIDRGVLNANAAFFEPYVADVPILHVQRVHLDHEENFLRWKLYEVIVDRSRM